MAIDSNTNYKHHFCLSRKRCFLILLLFNFIIVLIYYIHEQNQSQARDKLSISEKVNSSKIKHSIETSKATLFIKTVLENDYNHDDLAIFYNNTEKEFSLGLRCTRKNPQPQVTITPNTTNNQQIHNNITIHKYEYFFSRI